MKKITERALIAISTTTSRSTTTTLSATTIKTPTRKFKTLTTTAKTATVPTTTAKNPLSSILCSPAEKDPTRYLVPDLNNCAKFFSCQRLGRNRWIAHHMDCPLSTGFDEDLSICNVNLCNHNNKVKDRRTRRRRKQNTIWRKS